MATEMGLNIMEPGFAIRDFGLGSSSLGLRREGLADRSEVGSLCANSESPIPNPGLVSWCHRTPIARRGCDRDGQPQFTASGRVQGVGPPQQPLPAAVGAGEIEPGQPTAPVQAQVGDRLAGQGGAAAADHQHSPRATQFPPRASDRPDQREPGDRQRQPRRQFRHPRRHAAEHAQDDQCQCKPTRRSPLQFAIGYGVTAERCARFRRRRCVARCGRSPLKPASVLRRPLTAARLLQRWLKAASVYRTPLTAAVGESTQPIAEAAHRRTSRGP